MNVESFGKYRLFRQLGAGGMAEVFLGVTSDETLVALKRILPDQLNNSEFNKMFSDELFLAEKLKHRNIVGVTEHGEVDGRAFIAMEYVHGEDLRTVIGRSIKRDQFISRELSVFIVAEVLAGLHYAHCLSDSAGVRLGIVHRDVNPFNVLVGYDGAVKLFDFGIALAGGGVVQQARQGQLKGKFGYLSPEQCSGKAVDHRSDIFSVGVVLYELTVGKRLFKESTDIKTLNAITEGRVAAPRTVDPDYPAELQQIVLRALATDPDVRYRDAGEFRDALLAWLDTHHAMTSQAALAEFISAIFDAKETEAPVPPDGAGAALSNEPPTFDELERIQGGNGMTTNPTETSNAPDKPSAEQPPSTTPAVKDLFDENQKLSGSELDGLDMGEFSQGKGKAITLVVAFIALGIGLAFYAYKQKGLGDGNAPKKNPNQVAPQKTVIETRQIVIRSATPGANLWVDFTLAGQTPKVDVTLTLGEHTLYLYKPGHLPILKTITVTKNHESIGFPAMKPVDDTMAKGGGTFATKPELDSAVVLLGEKRITGKQLMISGLVIGYPYLLQVQAPGFMKQLVLFYPSPLTDEIFGITLDKFNDSPARLPVDIHSVPARRRFQLVSRSALRKVNYVDLTRFRNRLDAGYQYKLTIPDKLRPVTAVFTLKKNPISFLVRFTQPKKALSKVTILTHPAATVYLVDPELKDTLGATPLKEHELTVGTHKLRLKFKTETGDVLKDVELTIEPKKTLIKAYKLDGKKLVETTPDELKKIPKPEPKPEKKE